MDFILLLVDFVLHFDKHLAQIILDYGTLTYLFLFLIIFCETGLVVTPFLPGDSLLFAAGAFAAAGSLEISALFMLLAAAAIIGDSTNYWIGRTLGQKVTAMNVIKPEHLAKTHAYFEKYGGKTLVIARFAPFLRTFAPFVAGVGHMTYRRFLMFSVAGGFLWIGLFTMGGFFFGNLPFVKENFKLVILGVIVVSLLPAVIEVLRHRLKPANTP
ncbi:MAG: DedA family protein [Microvirga sp.]|nr:DedA family protein [Microvirga sp.]